MYGFHSSLCLLYSVLWVYSTILKINYVVEEHTAPFFRAEFTEQLATSQLGTTVVMVMGDGRLLPYTLWFHFLGVGLFDIVWSNKIHHIFITYIQKCATHSSFHH